MGRLPSRIAYVLLLYVAACGGKSSPKKPITDDTVKKPPPKVETEADREKKRRETALSIIPDGTTCLPTSLKQQGAPRLELGRVAEDAMICATDSDTSRRLGPIACWKVLDFGEGTLAYEAGRPLPGRNVTVNLDERCARGFCIPKDAKLSEDKLAYIAWNDDGSKAVVVTGDAAHVFDATARARESGFSIRGDKGVTNNPTAVHWVGDTIFIHGTDAGPASYLWGFKLDGTALGGMQSLGGKDMLVNLHGGSFAILGKTKVAFSERGFSTVTTYETDSGKRTKIVRKTVNGPCKPAEADAYWVDGDVSAKCKEHMVKTYGHLEGADAVLGRTNLLVLLRGPRLGELAVLDIKTLKETTTFKLPWCETATAAPGGSDKLANPDDESSAPAKEVKRDVPKKATRGATKKAPGPKEEDPDQGGQ